jgi:hypothetical protein
MSQTVIHPWHEAINSSLFWCESLEKIDQLSMENVWAKKSNAWTPTAKQQRPALGLCLSKSRDTVSHSKLLLKITFAPEPQQNLDRSQIFRK